MPCTEKLPYFSTYCFAAGFLPLGFFAIERCWGFLGDENELKDSLKAQLGSDLRGLVDSLIYTDTAAEEILMEECEPDEEV